jgi:TolB-like protein
VFERPTSWDPRLDPIVRQEAARLRKRLAKYYENGGAEAAVRIELPIGTYVPVFRGSPVEVQAPAVESPPVRRRGLSLYGWLLAGAVVLGLLLAAIAWRALFRHEAETSIAVLPFTNLTVNPAEQYFSDGLTDEIMDSLVRVRALRVIASKSAFQFKGRTVDIREVDRLLNVTHVLEGSVERSGDRVKIIARLERVSDRALVWSNTYERGASDLFAVQSELAAGIAGGLKTTVGVPPAHIPNPAALEFAMKGRYDLQLVTTESLTRAESEYQQAIVLDSGYAAAYIGLASAKYNHALARGSTYRTDAERQSAEQLFRTALDLDPNLPTAHAMLAAFAMQYDWDWGRAEQQLRLALTGPPNPNPEILRIFPHLSWTFCGSGSAPPAHRRVGSIFDDRRDESCRGSISRGTLRASS